MELDFSNDLIEKILFKRAITDKKWLNIMSNIYDERWFSVKNLPIIFNLVLKYYSKYNSVPNYKVIQALTPKYIEKHPECGATVADINELLSDVDAVSKLNVTEDVITANLKEFIRKHAFIQSLQDNIDILAMANSEKTSEKYEEVIDKCLENFDKVQKITFNDTDLGFDYFDETAMNEHWDRINNPDDKIAFGWPTIDMYTNGGVLKDGRMLGLFMAQAGLGKSVVLSNLTVNFLKQNLSVVVISLEMSQDVYASRFDAHISCKDINKLKENQDDAKARIKDFYKRYPNSNLIIKEFPPHSISTKDIQAYLENLKANGHKIDVLIVDYLNLVNPNKRTDSMFKDGLSVSEELRALSYLGFPVISAVQCNSEGMGTAEIDMQNVSESRGIVHTADFLFALYKLDNGCIGCKICKNRLGGQVGKHCEFAIDPETLIVAEHHDNDDIAAPDDEVSNAEIMRNEAMNVVSDIVQM